jgi:hypothetical protein
MMNRIFKIVAAFGILATLGMSIAPSDASARTTKCWKGTGGWYCY